MTKLGLGGGIGRRIVRGVAGGMGGLALLALAAGCSPTVKVEPPDEPIVINMNIKIEHEIRVKVEKDLEEAFAANEDIF